MRFFYSNILSSVRSKLPLFVFRKKKIHSFSFVLFKGFSPWKFNENRIMIYSIRFPFSSRKINIYLLKNEDEELRISVELFENGILIKDHVFIMPISRRNYDVMIIMTPSIIQFTLNKGKSSEIIQFNTINNFYFGLVYGPKIGCKGDLIIKMEYK